MDDWWGGQYKTLGVRQGSLAHRGIAYIKDVHLCTTTEAIELLIELAGLQDLVEEHAADVAQEREVSA